MAKLTNYVKVVFATAPINYGALALNRPGSAPSRTHAACCELLTHFSYELECLQDASCGIWNNYWSFIVFYVLCSVSVVRVSNGPKLHVNRDHATSIGSSRNRRAG